MRKRTSRSQVFLTGLCAITVLMACGAGPAKPRSHPKPKAAASWQCSDKATGTGLARGLRVPPYAPASPFNRPIPSSAQVSPLSSQLVAGLVDAAAGGRFVLSLNSYSVPVFYADARTRRWSVPLLSEWAPRKVARATPIPQGAKPDPSDDGHMVVIDQAHNCEYDFYKAQRTSDGSWTAGWMNAIRLGSLGVYPKGLSARGSGFALLAGLVFPSELRAGRIQHALVFSYPYTKAGGPVYPATESDGRTSSPAALPVGTRVRLDPTLDLAALPLKPYERVIARALQVYGMYLGDTGGGLALYAANPIGYARDPYSGLLPREYVGFENIPVDRFQVLLPGT